MSLDRASTLVIALLAVMALIVVGAGAVVVIVRPQTLNFHDYVQDVVILAGALGLGAGIGGGAVVVTKQLKEHEKA